jgi:hypothetical protein
MFMTSPNRANTRFLDNRIAASIGLAFALGFFSLSASAQSMTAQQFVSACENNLGNTVYLREQLKLQGSFTGETYASASGCNVQLAADASLELDTITLNFGGPLTVQGGFNSKFVAEKAAVNAPSIDLRMTGADNQVMIKEGRITANTGDLSIGFGRTGKFEMSNSGGWTYGGLAARGELRITASVLFSGFASDSGLVGGKGIRLHLTGGESNWKIEKSTINVSDTQFVGYDTFSSGPLSITSAAQKVNVDIIESNIRFASEAVNMRLSGSESNLVLKKVISQTGSRSVYLGAPGEKGIVMVENSGFYGNPDIVVQSGNFGATAIIGSPGYMQAQRSVRVTSGSGGSCIVTPLFTLSAPQVAACR